MTTILFALWIGGLLAHLPLTLMVVKHGGCLKCALIVWLGWPIGAVLTLTGVIRPPPPEWVNRPPPGSIEAMLAKAQAALDADPELKTARICVCGTGDMDVEAMQRCAECVVLTRGAP